MKAKDFLDYKLKDDNTEFGGISHIGETLREFISEVGMSETCDIDDVNKALKVCGIEPIVDLRS